LPGVAVAAREGPNLGKIGELDAVQPAVPESAPDLPVPDETLTKLPARDKIQADLVQLRYFAGMTSAEAAHILGISKATADRYWAYARAWLHQEVTGGRPAAGSPGPGADPEKPMPA
jgi:DNA-directed RNA polymerase specialized sigma24 family protein